MLELGCLGLGGLHAQLAGDQVQGEVDARGHAGGGDDVAVVDHAGAVADVDAARTALESTDASIDEIADRCGFGTAANLRKHFRRQVATTPTAYRRAFSRER